MSHRILTTAEIAAANLARLEARLGQKAPSDEKSFLRVLAGVEAEMDIGIYKDIAEGMRQLFSLTASGAGLDLLGRNCYCFRKRATAAVLVGELPAADGVVIPAGAEFVGETNGFTYKNDAARTAEEGKATMFLRCTETGYKGNLPGATFSISSQIAGAETVATNLGVLEIGADEESDQEYRPRVRFAERAFTGGGSSTDFKIWAEAVTGVKRAFCYSGRPPELGISRPGDRTVYVEATASIDADGIAPAWLLANVRAALNTDPDTGRGRQHLGITDNTLFIKSIRRTPLHIDVYRNDYSDENFKEACSALIDTYLRSLQPFVDGQDLPEERCDSVSTPGLSGVVNSLSKAFPNIIIYDVVIRFPSESIHQGVPLYVLYMDELVRLAEEIF